MFEPMNSRRTRRAPSPLVGEGWGEGFVGNVRGSTPHPAAISSLCSALAADLSHRKSGLPDLRTIVPNPGKPGFGGRGGPSMLRRYHSPTPSTLYQAFLSPGTRAVAGD
jgi:hypothetical protein